MSEPDQTENAILRAARQMQAEERTVFLERTCSGDEKLRERLDALLAAPATPTAPTPPSTSAGPAGTIITGDGSDTIDQGTTVGVGGEEAPGDFIGRYRLLEKIGEGGFGLVYVAEQTEPVKRNVALKIIKLGMDTRQVVARFEAERQALALMEHPNIAKVLDAGATDTGRPFFVMEFVRGVKITEYCDHNKLPTRKRLDLFMTVCRAIEHAHQKGIIHRDIKPSNILVTLQDGKPVPKVIDFGIAKATQGRLTEKMLYTQMDQFVGTPAYMSPEQAEASGADIDTRSDVFSLGVLLYELLTGETPLESKNLLERGFDEMRRLIREWEPQLPSIRLNKRGPEEKTTFAKRHSTDAPKLIKLVQGDLDWVVMKCLEKDRTRRYGSAAELTAELERFLANEPVSARPPSRLYRCKKMVERNQLAFAAGTAILMALILALVVMSWSVVKQKKARAVAEKASQDEARALDVAEAERAKAELALAQAQAAQRQSSVDQQRSLAAENRAEVSGKAAESARQQADSAREQAAAALHQAQLDRDKAAFEERQAALALAQAQTAQQLAEAAQNRAITEAAKREEAAKTAANETTLRQQAEGARTKAEAAVAAANVVAANAKSETTAALAGVAEARQNLSNYLASAAAPWAAVDTTLISNQARHEIDAATNNIPLYNNELALGLVEYRHGHYAEASNWLGRAVNESTNDPARAAEACAALALADWQLRQTNDARVTLARGQSIATAAASEKTGDLGPQWSQWVVARGLLQEAEAALKNADTTYGTNGTGGK